MAETGIHVGSGGSKHKLRRVLMCAGLVLAVAVLVGGAGAGLRWWQNREPAQRDETQEVHEGEKVFSEEVKNAQQLTQSGDYDKAHDAIEAALANPEISAQEKHDLLVEQGVAYESQQNYQAALESYRQAESHQESLQVAQSIANMAMRLDDKELAITYFKKAVTLAPNDSAGENLKRYFEDSIKFLETGESPS